MSAMSNVKNEKCQMSTIPGEGDEGAHPHDGLELADGKGFVAVRKTKC